MAKYMTVNFIGQCDWVMEYPAIWSTTIPHVSSRVFLDEINVVITGIKQIVPHNVVGLI